MVKVFITPMISSLHIMTLVDNGNEVEMLAIGILVIASNLGIYIAVSATTITLINKHLRLKNSIKIRNANKESIAMNFGSKSEIKSKEKIQEFLHSERVGRIATIDENGFPFVTAMNFVYCDDAIYVHGLARGEKYDNLKKTSKCGFEVDKELVFLPSYFSETPNDASKASTMYVSIVIKGHAEFVTDSEEKTNALNALMEKSQTEGQV